MQFSKHAFVAMTMACALLSSVKDASAGTATATITRIHIASGLDTSASVVGFKLSTTITSPDTSSGSCTGRQTDIMTIDVSTPEGKLLMSQLMAAFLAGKTINFYGTALTNCLTDPAGFVGEEIDLVFVTSS